MLNITIDPSMLTGKNRISDCELTVNIAGCAWDEVDPLPRFEKTPDNTPEEVVEEMRNFFYPWRWDKPNQIVLQWLDETGKEIEDDQGNIIEQTFQINPINLKGYKAKFDSDKDLVRTQHYEAILNNALIEFDDDGNVIFENGCLKLREDKIRFKFLSNSGEINETVFKDLTDLKPSLNMSIGKFAQKLSPLNLGLNLTFFAKGSNVILPDDDAKSFMIYLKSDVENNRWNIVSDPRDKRTTDKGQVIKSFYYPDKTNPKMILHSLVTLIPTSKVKSEIILLRDGEGNFQGKTKVEVSDSDELLDKKSFKEKIIGKTISIFDLPELLYQYLEQNRSHIKDIDEAVSNFPAWCEQIKELFITLLRDAYSIGNELVGVDFAGVSNDNSAAFLNDLVERFASAAILNDLVKRYNESVATRSEYIELNDLVSIIKAFADFNKNLSFADWWRIVELSAVLNKKLTEITVPAKNEEAINHWLSLWKAIVSNKHSKDESDPQNEIIKGKNDLLKLQIVDVINKNFLGSSDDSQKLFGEVADKFFENYNPGNLFIESIVIDINGNTDDSQFQTGEAAAVKTVLVETCLKDYVVRRKDGGNVFPSIIDVLIKIESIPFPENGQTFWERFAEFSVSFTNNDPVVSLDLDKKIKELLSSSLIEKVTDIPPNILIKVDDETTDDDLSDEISGHLLLMQRAEKIHEPVSDNIAWQCLNWSKINLVDKPKGKELPMENNYLIPSFLPLTDDLKNFYLTLSNEKLSLVAGHDFSDDKDDAGIEDSDYQLKYLFDNGSAETVPPAYALWYGYNYNFAGFVALNSGVLAKALRTDDDWVTLKDGVEIEESSKAAYKHLRRVPFSKIYSGVLRENNLPVLPIPEGLLTIASELEETNQTDETKSRKDLPTYLLYDNKKAGNQKSVKIELGKPLTNFWNWYAWNGDQLANKVEFQAVLSEELKVRGNPKIQNDYLHDPALENKLKIVVEQIFPVKENKGGFTLDLRETNPGNILSKVKNEFLTVEISSGDKVEIDKENKIIKVPEGFVVKVSVHGLTKPEYFQDKTDEKPDTRRFHAWMTRILDSQNLTEIADTDERYYLTKPVEMIFEAAKRPYKIENNEKVNLLSNLQVWKSLIPVETEQRQISLNLEKNHQDFAYFSRTLVDHQVWHWNGRLSDGLLKLANSEEVLGFPVNLDPKPPKNQAPESSENIQPVVNKPETYAETNYAMKWEAWEFSDRPDSSALRHTTNLRAAKSETKEQQTIFTDNRQTDEKALYYRFSAELFGRYELLGGEYAGSVRSAISILDKDGRDKKPVDNQWKRYFKPSRKTARLPKPVIRFVIPLTSSIDECQKYDDIRSASLMIVMNDIWFSEMGLAEKCEIGIELLKYPYFPNDADEQKHYLNAGLDPVISGEGLKPIDESEPIDDRIKDINERGADVFYIEKPEPAANEENPVAVSNLAAEPENAETNVKIDEENPVAVFTPEGPAGLTYDFATATPKLISSTFILKVDNINQFLTENQQMNAWSMVQIAARRNIHRPLWEFSDEDFSSVIWNFCKLDREKAEIERPKISEEFADAENQTELNDKLKTLWLDMNGDEANEAEFKITFEKIIGQYNRSKKRAALQEKTFKGIKSKWTAKEWVQFIPDTDSMIPLQWKRENTSYGFVSFQSGICHVPSGGEPEENINDEFVSSQPSKKGIIKPNFMFDFPTLSSEQISYEAKTERYLVISEKTQNAGGQPIEKYKATYKFDKVENHFDLNDPKEAPPNFDGAVEGYARIISVRVLSNSKSDGSIWGKLFGENKETSVGFKDIQEDAKAALPLISKRFSIKIMSYIAENPENYSGQVVGDGQCVAFVKAAAGAPVTSSWSKGVKVKGATISKGTAIATFVNGSYPNSPTGQHAAIYISQDSDGINVWDQWIGQPVHQRKIRFRGGSGSLSNDGDAFSVIN